MFITTELHDITQGEWIIPAAVDSISGIQDDSRAVVQGVLFVALRGELANGHHYLRQAAEAGAAAVLVDESVDDAVMDSLRARRCSCLRVKDTLVAYHAIANAWRWRIAGNKTIVGITGSCGKTSTKELIAAVLGKRFGQPVLKTVGNTNNFYGVPRNLLRLNEQTTAAVIEMGSNHPGEIARLAGMVQPTIGVVSNIGPAHLEFFKDLRGVAEEKGDLLAALPDTADAVAILPAEAASRDVLEQHAGKRRVITFGTKGNCDVTAEYLGLQSDGYHVRFRTQLIPNSSAYEFTWGIGGAHQASNAAAAAAVGIVLGLGLGDIADALQTCELPGARMKIETLPCGAKLVNDAYNANPASMKSTLEWFAEISKNAPRVTLVLGDMLELGEKGLEAHIDILQNHLRLAPNGRVILVGPIMKKAYEHAALESLHTGAFLLFNTAENALNALKGTCIPDEFILLKSSNGIGLAKQAWQTL